MGFPWNANHVGSKLLGLNGSIHRVVWALHVNILPPESQHCLALHPYNNTVGTGKIIQLGIMLYTYSLLRFLFSVTPSDQSNVKNEKRELEFKPWVSDIVFEAY